MCVCVCVCVCVFVSSILATVPLVKARRVRHFAVDLEDYTTCSAYFSVQPEPNEVTQEGVNTGAFFLFLHILSCAPPSSCGACLQPVYTGLPTGVALQNLYK